MTAPAHYLDGTPAGTKALELLNLIANLAYRLDDYEATKANYFEPLLADKKTSGLAMHKRQLAAEQAGAPGTDFDVLIGAWAYAVEALWANRCDRWQNAWPLLVEAATLYGHRCGIESADGRSERTSASLTALDRRDGAINAMHVAGRSDSEIGKMLGISRERVHAIRNKRAPKT